MSVLLLNIHGLCSLGYENGNEWVGKDLRDFCPKECNLPEEKKLDFDSLEDILMTKYKGTIRTVADGLCEMAQLQ